MVDLAAQLGDLLLLDAEQRTAQVADHRLDAFARRRAGDDAPALDQVVQALERALAHEHVDLALAFVQQPLDQPASDEAGRSCDEVGHRAAEPIRWRRCGPGARAGAAAALAGGEARGAARAVREHLRAGLAPRARAPRRAAARSPRSRRGGRRASCAWGKRGETLGQRERALAGARPRATTSVSSPIASASSAPTMRPVRIRSSARPRPTMRGSRWVPPSISGTPQRRSG